MTALAVAIGVAIPLVLAIAVAWPATRRAAAPLAPWAAAPALACALWPTPTVLEAPHWLLGLRFGLDETGRSFLLLAALLWLLAGWAARAYHAHDERRTTLWVFWLATLTGNLWLIVARDAAGFYAGFALMTFAGYGLVIHVRSPEAWRAGRVYLVMALLGEAALLAGLLLRVAPLGSIDLPLPAQGGAYDTLAAVLLFAGFGVKAGVFGLHMWLPLAHPVAPTPASAVLSGAMIKAGVLGWLRFLPLGAEPWPGLGATAMALGLAAAFAAVAVGLTQRAPKTMLAYSSVSQMGFIVVGVGAALLHPPAWPALAVAVTIYALHHGLAKGALFLGVAALPDDGAARRWALAAQALPALALAGAPWTSGAVAKDALKAALAVLPEPWPAWLAWLLPAAAIGTTLLMARLLLVMAADRGHATRALAPPWLAAVAASVGVGWLVTPPAPPASALAAVAPVAIGIALAWAVARRRPLATRGAPCIAPGDLLTWLEPATRAAWRGLLRLAAAYDRVRNQSTARRGRPWRITGGEPALRRLPVVGAMLLLLLLTAALLAQRS